MRTRVCRVKGDQIKISLDYVQSNDYEMVTSVLGGLDMVKDIFIFSDKCTSREIQKTTDEFTKDLKKCRYGTRVSIWKYIKDADAMVKKGDDDEEVVAAPQTEQYDNTVSQSPKINYQIVQGLAEQITANQKLTTFKLVNYRMNENAWEILGKGLRYAKNLRYFACNACNLYADDNLLMLLAGFMPDDPDRKKRRRAMRLGLIDALNAKQEDALT